MTRKPSGELRRGWTTGACATAAARAAYHALLTGAFPDPIAIRLPRGQQPRFSLALKELAGDRATAGVIKDAGDDPDVTHGALITATVRHAPAGSGVLFRAGEGVGTVTRAGLPLPVGEPAINPVPRRMMAETIAELARAHGEAGDVEITVAIPGGAELAKKTANGRLGIVGGLSVLGTTGIVIPYSCASWIHAIHRGIDVARANGIGHIAAATGRTSEAAVQALYGLPEMALIDMGDFAGGMLKYLRDHPLPKLTIAGGFAKMAKLAQGALDLHSARSSVDMAALRATLGKLGVASDELAGLRNVTSAGAILDFAKKRGLPLGDAVARQARGVALATLSGGTAVETILFDRAGIIVGRAAFDEAVVE
jgi:cobalt-precorrin-5B (C1)-methyltransferase